MQSAGFKKGKKFNRHIQQSGISEMISKNSPFRRLPIELSRRQILYFDAFRLSAEMAAISFQRLKSLLMQLSKKGAKNLCDKAVQALVDAYSVVDSVHRFRETLRVTPGLKHNTEFKLFMRRTQTVEELRHIVQHYRLSHLNR